MGGAPRGSAARPRTAHSPAHLGAPAPTAAGRAQLCLCPTYTTARPPQSRPHPAPPHLRRRLELRGLHPMVPRAGFWPPGKSPSSGHSQLERTEDGLYGEGPPHPRVLPRMARLSNWTQQWAVACPGHHHPHTHTQGPGEAGHWCTWNLPSRRQDHGRRGVESTVEPAPRGPRWRRSIRSRQGEHQLRSGERALLPTSGGSPWVQLTLRVVHMAHGHHGSCRQTCIRGAWCQGCPTPPPKGIPLQSRACPLEVQGPPEGSRDPWGDRTGS